MINKLVVIANERKVQLGFLFLLTLIITLQKYFLENMDEHFTMYNNYIIFKQSFFHFIQGQDLYQLYPQEHYDLFKYSPTFALFMGLLSYLPNVLGLFLWNLINVLVLYFAILKFPFASKKAGLLAGLFILLEVLTATQNSQSNALLAGLIVLGYVALENRKIGLAALLIVSTIYIKLFGLVALVLFLFYPNKVKSAIQVLLWTLVLGFIPLLVISFDELINLYQSWIHLLFNDHATELKFSVMGFLHSWFGVPVDFKGKALIIGMIIFCIPLVQYKKYELKRYRLLYLSSVLLWVVLFNHMAESATFVIAVLGVAIWYFTKEEKSFVDKLLLGLTIVFTMLSPSDIFPSVVRNEFFIPYVIKVVPCILVWMKIQVELYSIRQKK